ncbi:MAG: hypothetical protein GVX78_03590 [Bacteroidetes bacterium]|jgi:NH3-dependent NAD+ synthetase|nr:hypothetical protein [Bacteroidota bacterium]
MKSVENQKNAPYEPDYLMNKTEVRQLFEEKLNIGRTTYHKYYRPKLKFLPHSLVKDAVLRIPYRIIKGMLNRIVRNPKPGDPSIEEIQLFQKDPTELPENW